MQASWNEDKYEEWDKKRKVHSAEFKAKAGLEALKDVMTINQIGQEYEVHPVQVVSGRMQSRSKPRVSSKTNEGPKRYQSTGSRAAL